MNNRIKTIILKGGDSFMPFDGLDIAFSYYSSYWLPIRAIKKVARKLKFRFLYPIFYGQWKKKLKSTNLIILFDAGIENADDLARYIKRVNPKIRIVFWYWNPVGSNKIALNSKHIDEVWTYDRFDAKKYNLKYNFQFCPQMLTNEKNSGRQGVSTDIIFLGADKGRGKILEELKVNAEKQGLRCDFTIVKSKEDEVKYEDYLERADSSKCVVDIVPSQSCGLTLRPLEALVLKKKLITNYEDIVNYDFYDKANIFILGKDNINELADFINSPYEAIDKSIVDSYSFENWLKRVMEDKSIKP